MTARPGGRAALAVHRPFTRAQALAHGITDRDLESAAYQALFRGVHVAADVAITPHLEASGALLLFRPGAHASHTTAARLYRLPIPAIPDVHVTVERAADRRRRS